eukprot:TRINITY_DN49459_c0_g1_i1.p1 TRINITY_DN49459_c0_g1~~TRINITY_DN49459_c0_g1_i1.p1  ORF type:complete len:299 (-),score=57.90 TRINITY_DN49459_c0_g1_i1:205-1101(-)
MSRLREMMLQKSKQPAKILPMDRIPGGGPRPGVAAQAGPVASAAHEKTKAPNEKASEACRDMATQCDSTLLPVALRPQTPGVRRAQPARNSEGRRPRGSNSDTSSGQANSAPDSHGPGPAQGGRGPRPPRAGGAVARSHSVGAYGGGAPARQPGRQDGRAQDDAASDDVRRRRPGPPGDSEAGSERSSRPRVPAYLRKRKEELDNAKRLAALPPEPEPPPGYRRVGEDEKRQTLETLQQRRAETEKGLRSLPFKLETVGQRRREKDLEGRLEQLDRLMGMFKQPIVFVPADAAAIGSA